MLRYTPVAAMVCFVLSSGFLNAQQNYSVNLQAEQVVPPVTSTATGGGTFVFDPVSKMLAYNLWVNEATGGTSFSASIHAGEVGVNGPLSFPLAPPTGGPFIFEFVGTAGPLSAVQEQQLVDAGLYVNVTSPALPAGELRGQILVPAYWYTALADGGEVVPGTGSLSTAVGSFYPLWSAAATLDLFYTVTVTGPLAVTSATLNEGRPGTNGPVVATLTQTTPYTFSGGIPDAGTDLLLRLNAGLLYVQIGSYALPAGEIRGQILPAFAYHGHGSHGVPSFPAPVLLATGTPTPGGSLDIQLAEMIPNSSGLLLIGTTGTARPFAGGCELYVAPPWIAVFLTQQGVAADGLGVAVVHATIPPTAATSTWVQMQFFGTGSPATGNVYSTNGLGIHILP